MKQAIGIFDSGLGGLTIMKEIHQRHPGYDYIYLGDNARAPYGPRDFETVYQYTLEAVQWLFNQGCPLVVLACNTASAKALRTIQQRDLPGIDPSKRVLGVIRPTTEIIGDYTETKHIGILGTQGTVDSGSYVIEVGKAFPDVHVHQQACPDWVPLVESGDYLDFSIADPIIRDCLIKLLDQSDDIDTVLLACTHYPLLFPRIRAMLPPDITVVSQGAIVADSLSAYLLRHPEMEQRLSRNASLTFCTTGDTESFGHAAGIFWGDEVKAEGVSMREV